MYAPIPLRLAGCALDPDRPLLVNLVITRRCNLRCGYCFEHDQTSAPVPTATLEERIDHLVRLRAVFVTLTGGESLLHPDVVALVAYARARGLVPFLNTNGTLLTAETIRALGAAGLAGLQLSVDGVEPTPTSRKALRVLLPKLRLLARHARFPVRVNSVLGAGPPEEVLTVARTAIAMGFDAKCSLARDAAGALIPLDARARAAYEAFRRIAGRTPSLLREDFYQVPLLRDGRVDWKCRGGARFFHVDPDGLVRDCPSGHAGGVPLAAYGVDEIRRAFAAPKPCAGTCTQSYAHQASRLDGWRPQAGAPRATSPVRHDAAGRVALAVVAA